MYGDVAYTTLSKIRHYRWPDGRHMFLWSELDTVFHAEWEAAADAVISEVSYDDDPGEVLFTAYREQRGDPPVWPTTTYTTIRVWDSYDQSFQAQWQATADQILISYNETPPPDDPPPDDPPPDDPLPG